MNRCVMGMTAVVGFVWSGAAQAHDGQKGPAGGSPSAVVINNSGNGTGDKIEVNPTKGEKVTINNSGNGTGDKIIVGPDPGGKVVINASGNGKGDKIIVEEAPGEHVVIRGSANGKNSGVVIEKVPGPIRPLTSTSGQTTSGQKGGSQSHHHR